MPNPSPESRRGFLARTLGAALAWFAAPVWIGESVPTVELGEPDWFLGCKRLAEVYRSFGWEVQPNFGYKQNPSGGYIWTEIGYWICPTYPDRYSQAPFTIPFDA